MKASSMFNPLVPGARWRRALARAAILAGAIAATTPVAAEPALEPAGTPGGAPVGKMRDVVIWGSELALGDGRGLAFGGQHQRSADGRPRTRVLRDGEWQPIVDQLRANNPLQETADRLNEVASQMARIAARGRYIYLQGADTRAQRADYERDVAPRLSTVADALDEARASLAAASGLQGYEAEQARRALARIGSPEAVATDAWPLAPESLRRLRDAGVAVERAAELLDAEPPARVVSPLAYDSATGLYVLFGGDHYDFLMNDLWTFDPLVQRWQQHHPDGAPPPRGNHAIEAPGDGTITVSGGYTYADKDSYGAKLYVQLGPDAWRYDLEARRWVPPDGQQLVEAGVRQYRSAVWLPEHYLSGERPDAAAHERTLASLPANTWVAMEPPLRPQALQLTRDWGTSVMSPDHDLFLQWGGGHSAHCGTDVLHYHFATNRWEQPYPVEVCLGNLYSTAHYPGGFSFNGNPWMIMHAYKSYAYDTSLRNLVLTGRTANWKYRHDPYFYLYDPTVGDWTSRHPLHEKLHQTQIFLNSRVHGSPQGVLFWGRDSSAFRLDPGSLEWKEFDFEGTLPTSGTDGGGMVFDPLRNRMLVVRKKWQPGGGSFNGQMHALDLDGMKATALSPAGARAVPKLFLREPAYNAQADLFLWSWQDWKVKGNMVAYDPKGNRWVSLDIGGKAPFGVSTGHVYDERRGLHWVTNHRGQVWALRLDAATANLRPLP